MKGRICSLPCSFGISDAIGDSFDASKKCRDALQDLEELANDIGIAWDGNLKARAGSLDPDSYSQEVMRGQRTRLRTNERLRTPLETLFREQWLCSRSRTTVRSAHR